MRLNLQKSYTSWVDRLKAQHPPEEALKQAVGGEFEAFGIIEMEILRFYGLRPDHMVIDVGCGSGRLAIPLSRSHKGLYLGTDLVQELIDHARSKCGRADWRFELAKAFVIPAEDQAADMVCFFSVFTHLLHEQTYLYLEEARRVLKPGGKIVFSFLEFESAAHWAVFESTVNDARRGEEHPFNVFFDRIAIRTWAAHLDLQVESIRGGDESFVPLAEALTLGNGSVMRDFGRLGQSICALSRA